jgi:CHAT domain-containing protein/Tfp pilus assembly protein PilF
VPVIFKVLLLEPLRSSTFFTLFPKAAILFNAIILPLSCASVKGRQKWEGKMGSKHLLKINLRAALAAYFILGCLIEASATTPGNHQDTAHLKQIEISPSESGNAVDHMIEGGTLQVYHLSLQAGQFLRITVRPKGATLIWSIWGPDGKKISGLNDYYAYQFAQSISLAAQATGVYKLEVSPLRPTATQGSYAVTFEGPRTCTEQDREKLRADAAIVSAIIVATEETEKKPADALKELKEVLPLLEKEGDKDREGNALFYAGSLCETIDETMQFITQAMAAFKSAKNLQGEALALFTIGTQQEAAKNINGALETYFKTLDLQKQTANRETEAIILHNIGTLYLKKGEIQKSIQYLENSVTLKKLSGDQFKEANSLAVLGGAYQDRGDLENAFRCYDQALPIYRALGEKPREADALVGLALLYYRLGDYQATQNYYEKARGIYKETEDKEGEAIVLNGLGNILLRTGKNKEGFDYLNQAIALVRPNGQKDATAFILTNLGKAYGSLGENQKSIEVLTESLALSREANSPNSEARALLFLGDAYDKLGQESKALELYNQSLQIGRRIEDHYRQATNLYSIAQVYRNLGDYREARKNIEGAIEIVENLRAKIHVQDLKTSYFSTIRSYYDLYIDILMRLFSQQQSDEFRARALEVSERARARSLLDLLAESKADIRQGVDNALVDRERQLSELLSAKAEKQITFLASRLKDEQRAAPATEAQHGSLEKEIEDLNAQLADVRAKIRSTSPRYAALTQPPTLTLKEIQQKVLDKGSLLLEYAVGEDKSYLWAVTQDSIRSVELPRRSEIEQLARRLHGNWSKPPQRQVRGKRELVYDPDSGERVDFRQLVSEASQMLLAPVSDLLKKRRLLIVADGALHFIPFAALPAPSARPGQRLNRPLMLDHEIVNLPSASTVLELRGDVKNRVGATKTLAVLADPVFNVDERVRRAQNRQRQTRQSVDSATREIANPAAQDPRLRFALDRLKIRRLPGTRAEALQITNLVAPSERMLALDFDASRKTAFSDRMKSYRYVHFATHGFVNTQNPEQSGLVLSLVDGQGAQQDGFLFAHEIYNMKLDADLVVLSACQTGLGKEVNGEGLIGLSRGFMYAGSPRVIVSLWPVSDRATQSLMSDLYRGILKERLTPGQALRAAQVRMWRVKQWRSPFFWAPFILLGEWQ